MGTRISEIQVQFSEALNPIDANAPANYDLRNAGPDGIFGTSDDVVYAVTPHYDPTTFITTLAIDSPDGILPSGTYQLTVFGEPTVGIHDLSGNLLDGNGDGTPGGNYVRVFFASATGGADEPGHLTGQRDFFNRRTDRYRTGDIERHSRRTRLTRRCLRRDDEY